MVSITHSGNGLELSLPESLHIGGQTERLTVSQTSAGFLVTLGRESVRRVKIEVTVALVDGQAPEGEWPSERKVSGRRLHYRIDRTEGGSGGTQFDFHGWEPCTSGHLQYAQGDVVEEPGKPDFSLVWRVIAGTRPPS